MDEPMSTEGAVILLEDIATLIRRYNKLGGEALGQMLDGDVDLWRQRGVPEDFIAKVQHRRLMAVEYAIEVLKGQDARHHLGTDENHP